MWQIQVPVLGPLESVLLVKAACAASALPPCSVVYNELSFEFLKNKLTLTLSLPCSMCPEYSSEA